MGTFLITLAFIAFIITGGLVISVGFYRRDEVGLRRFRRIQRVRTITPTPDGTVIQETIEESIDEKPAVSEEMPPS